MKKGFTLLELIVVIIILGVLAILGFTQYSRMIEKSRGAEAKTILGDIRKLGAAYYLEFGNVMAFGGTGPSSNFIGGGNDQIPNACHPGHWFSYSVTTPAVGTVSGTATRCSASGKTPQGGSAADTVLTLTSNFVTGTDTWGGNGAY